VQIHRTPLAVANAVTSRHVPEDSEGSAIANVQGHDRVKNHLVSTERPYLRELGVVDQSRRVVASMSRKWKQINKFVEIVDRAIASSGLAELDLVSMVDYGAGRGYLTFALHDHLSTTLGKGVTTIGVERRPELVAEANLTIERLSLNGVKFVAGDIETAAVAITPDVVVALHACDIATDLAIHQGVAAGARLIVVSPCCHKELRAQMKNPAVLDSMLRFGIHQAQEADMVTDTLRALLLESRGYRSNVFEFVGLEHTSKNKMILAVLDERDPTSAAAETRRTKARLEVAALKSFYGIDSQHLEALLDRPRPTATPT
jgi:Methyltransferase domain